MSDLALSLCNVAEKAPHVKKKFSAYGCLENPTEEVDHPPEEVAEATNGPNVHCSVFPHCPSVSMKKTEVSNALKLVERETFHARISSLPIFSC